MSEYIESKETAREYRASYLSTLQGLVEKRRMEADTLRENYLNEIINSQEKCREDYYQMLGWPLEGVSTENRKADIKCIFVAKDELCNIYRLTAEILSGLQIYALLCIPHKNSGEKPPVSIVQHGGGGTPELIGSLYDTGSANYNDMAKRILKRGYATLMPQHLLWNAEIFGDSYDRVAYDKSLKQLGGSVTAVEVYNTMVWVDYLYSRKNEFDVDKLIMAGLSYGGFYTLMCAAADIRIKSAYSSCFFNDRYDYNWFDWVWKGSALKFLDAEICALIYPRKLYVEIGNRDELFDDKKAVKHIEKVEQIYKYNIDNVKFKIMDKGHEFDPENDGLDFILKL